jgi:uncharacterized membrane protein
MIFFPRKFFSKEDDNRIIQSIKIAEKETSGEIRVHFQRKMKGNLMDAAVNTFYELKMDETNEKNGVLFYFVPKKKKFAVIGDQGINEKVPDNFWEEVKYIIEEGFKKKKKVDGICEAIELAGFKLKEFFPYKDHYDLNELPDEISYL